MKKTVWLLVFALLFIPVFPGTGMPWGGLTAYAAGDGMPAVNDSGSYIRNVGMTSLDLQAAPTKLVLTMAGTAAPTNPVVDDAGDTFGWTWTPGYESVADYEYSVNSGLTWNDCTANPQPVGNRYYAVGTVQVRVKGSAADGYAGEALASNQAYTKRPVFDGGYPQTSNVTETGLDLTVKMDEVGIAYYKAYSHGADAPSAAQVKNNGTSLAIGTAYVSQWGSSGSGNGQFNTPNMVAVDQAGNIYVADDVNNRVQKFDGSGNWLAQIGSSGNGDGQFQNVNGVAVDADGNVYVTDWSLNRVQKFNSSGTFLCKWGGSGSGNGQFSYPYGVAVDAAGNVYVADSHNNRIQKFDGSGTFIRKWGTGGTGNGQFNLPVGVAVDSCGNVYVVDNNNKRIQKFDGSGIFLAKWGSSGSGNGQFNSPEGIAVDHCGNVYVADGNNKRIQKFSGSGTFISKWGSSGSGDGQFSYPYGVAIDSAGNIYVSDRPNKRIEKFSYINTANFTGLTVGQTYDIYVAAENSGGTLQAAPSKITVTMAGAVASIASTVPMALTEAAANDGSLSDGTIVITIANGTLADPLVKADVIAAYLPAGLDYTVTRTDNTHLTINITGNAANHADANDVNNLTFTIAQAKVTGATNDLTTANISIEFNDPVVPAAPTNPVVDDANNTFGWTKVTGFDSVSDYEYTKDGGTTWNTCTANPQTGFDGDIAADQVRVRVKADPSSGRPAGNDLLAGVGFTGNLGTESNPYPITSVAELEQVRTDAAAGLAYWYKLMNDLDLSGIATWAPIGDDSHPFKGHFDGNSHVIRNLSIGGTGGANIGLFGCTSTTAGIKDLGLKNVDINLDSGQYVAGLAGQNKGIIDNCSVTGIVHIDNISGYGIVIGGLVGLNYGGSISHSYSTADVTGTTIVGGLAGGNTLGTISGCYATGNVSATSYPTGETGAGGLVGANSGGTISGCYATGNVSSQGDGVGGLVGGNGNDDSTGSQGNISNCYATGNISNTGDGTGGLAGGNDTGSTISNCYATGTVSSTGQGTGVLVGGNSGSIGRSYALTGGSPLVGYSDGTVTGSSLQSSANLRKQATFSGWDFSTVWGITEDMGYPSLVGVTVAPAITGTSPADGAAGVSPDQVISLTFGEKIQVGTGINGVTFNGTAIGYDYSISGNVLTINLASSLEDGDYTVTVPAAAVKSLQAIPLAADYSFGFTTSPPVQYTLTVIKVGNGTVTPDVGDHLYDEGTVVHLAAEPAPGWTFSGWSGDVDAGGSTAAMDGNKSVTATFVENAVTHTIAASAGTGGSISPEGEVLVNDGASRTFNIQAGSSYIIADVLVDGISQGRISSYTFSNVTVDHTIEARFESGFEITANTSWSAITAGSGPGGHPALSDTIVIQNNATLTVDVVDGLAGTIQLGGAGASGGAGTLRFLAGKTITVNSLLLGNGNNGGNVDMSAGGTLKISGAITSINYYGSWTHGTGTVDYCGGDQTVQGRSYYNLVTSGSGTKTLTNDMAAIYGNLTVGSGTTLYLDNSSANHNTPTSTGTLTLQDNATLLINSGNLFPTNYITYSLAAGSTVNYNRSGIQNIAVRTYGNLITSGSGTKTLQGNTVVNGNLTIGAGTTLDTKQNYGYSLTVRGDWTNNGSFTAWTSTVILGSGATHSLGGSAVTSFNNLTLSDTVNASQNFNVGGSGTGTLTVNTGAVLNPAADVVINGSGPRGTLTGSGTIKVTRTIGQQHMYNQYYMSTFSLTGLTVEYAASGNQDVWYPGNSYGNLVLSGGGTKKPLWPLTVYGNLTIGGGVTLNQNGMDITLGGNWINHGSLTASNNAVTLNGARVQEMTGSTSFQRLTLNNAAGLTIHSDVIITNTLTLTSGKITTGTNKVTLSYASGTISGANSNNYIVGGLQKIIPTGATTRTFEVGTATSYNPMTVAFGNVATAGNLAVKATAGDHPNVGTSVIDPSKNVNVYWTLINSGTVFDSFGAIFNFTAGNIDADASTGSFIIGKYDGSAWTYPDIGTRNATSTQATGMTSLSDFVLGEGREGDITVPVVADSTIRTSGLSDTSVTLSWNKATDDVSAQSALQYMVYRSDSNNIDTVENIEATGTPVGSYAADINTKQISGLTAGTTYYFNVVVKDEAGNKTAYTMQEVTTSAAIDGGGLNYESENWAITPSMAVYDNHLYTAWVENTNGHTQIRVKKNNGTAWSSADSDSLNLDSGKNAYNPVLCAFNGSLYLAWYEDPGTDKIYQVYIRKYAGETNWGEGVKLSYSNNKSFNVKLKVYDNTLYAFWVENNGSGPKNQIRAKMTSNGGSWETADDHNTLNYNPADHVTIPSAEVYGNALYVAWSEKGKIRLKKYNGSLWSGADDGSLNYDDSKIAHVPILLNNGSLYLIWLELNESDICQVRAQKYNGTSWEPVDSVSLNIDENQGATMLNGTVYHGTLYAAWTENGKVRIKTYDEDEETWVSADEGNINYDASKASSGLTFVEYQGKLYLSWKEDNESSVEQIRVKIYQEGK